MSDNVNHPSHYLAASVTVTFEPIELCEKYGFVIGNAMKYILRAPFKGHEIEDLKKAQWYLQRLTEDCSDDTEFGTIKHGFKWARDTVCIAEFAKVNKYIKAMFNGKENGDGLVYAEGCRNCIDLINDRIEELTNTTDAEHEITERIKAEGGHA